MLELFADIFMLKTHPHAVDLSYVVFPSPIKTKHIPSLSCISSAAVYTEMSKQSNLDG